MYVNEKLDHKQVCRRRVGNSKKFLQHFYDLIKSCFRGKIGKCVLPLNDFLHGFHASWLDFPS